jgi:hypothetical protein
LIKTLWWRLDTIWATLNADLPSRCARVAAPRTFLRCTVIPLLKEIQQPWRTTICIDFGDYENHVYRMVHCVFAMHTCAEVDQRKVVIAAAHHDSALWSDGTVVYLPHPSNRLQSLWSA